MSFKKNRRKEIDCTEEKNLKKDLWTSKRRGNRRMESKKKQRIRVMLLEIEHIKYNTK